MAGYIDVVFDGPPAAESGRFVEVEDETGASITAGEWIERENGYWALRIATPEPQPRTVSTLVFEPGCIVIHGGDSEATAREVAARIMSETRRGL